MRILLLVPLLAIAACSSSGEDAAANNAQAQAPTPKPTGPPPMTPTMNIQAAPGSEPAWLDPANSTNNAKAPVVPGDLDRPVTTK